MLHAVFPRPALLGSALAASVVLGALPAGAAPPPVRPPVHVQVTAPSPDPAWTLRIDNEGTQRIRIAADIRLLSIQIQKPGSRAWRRCKPAPGQTPTRFPAARELYLAPGESWVEEFDPRLFCFGAEGDLLRGGTTVRFRFGFDPRGGRADREPFVVQGTDSPPSFPAARQLIVPTIVLSHLPPEATRAEALPAGASRANAPLPKTLPPPPPPGAGAPAGQHADGERRDGPGPRASRGSSRDRSALELAAEKEQLEKEKEVERRLARERELATTYAEPPIPERPVDRMAPDLDLYVDRWSSGGAPRDLMLRIHAKNEGGRALAAVLRSRMLRFRVEGPLVSDNKTTGTTECIVDDRSHGVPVEMVRNYRPGDRLQIPFLLAEVCPRGTFDRPGLYRVTPLLESSIEGEAVKHQDAFQGRVRALQPALARIGASRLPFYDEQPRAVSTRRLDHPDEDAEPPPHRPGETEPPAAPTP